MDLRHTAGFGATEFLQDGTNRDIVNQGRVKLGVRLEGRAEHIGKQFFGI